MPEDLRASVNTGTTPADQPGSFSVPTYCSDECRVLHDASGSRIAELERVVRDHAQRFDTLQTPWWKRVWFWVDGWPWYDLNGVQRRRPWHRGAGR